MNVVLVTVSGCKRQYLLVALLFELWLHITNYPPWP